MAYNLPSLAYSINHILHPHPKLSSVHDLEKQKLESLLKKVTTLQQILENLPLPKYNGLEMLQRQVIDLSHRAEDIVDSACVNQASIQQKRGENSSSTIQIPAKCRRVRHFRKNKKAGGAFLQDLQKGIEEFHSNKDLTIVDDSSQQQAVTEKFKDLTIVDSSQQQTVIEEFEVPTPESSARRPTPESSLFIFTSEGVVEPLPRTSEGVTGSRKCWGLDKDIVNQISIQTKGGDSPTSSIPDTSGKEKAGEMFQQDLTIVDSSQLIFRHGVGESSTSSIPNPVRLHLRKNKKAGGAAFLQDLPIVDDSSQQQAVTDKFKDLTIVDSSEKEKEGDTSWQYLMEEFDEGESSTSSIPDSSEKQKVGETFLQDLQKLIEEFDSLINKVPTIVDSSQQTLTKKSEDLTIVNPNPESSSSVAGVHARMDSSVSSLKRHFTSKGVAGSQKLVGLEKDLEKLKYRLTRNKRDLEVITIVGMGGIGKTTLARELYHYACTSNIDRVAWAEISQVPDINKILTTLMSCLTGKDASDFTHMGTIGLQDALHKTLLSIRYLIVLDDIWDTNVWDNLRMLFPEDRSKSTIILTTRVQEVAKYATENAISSSLHTMRPLGDDDSWHLFSGKVFAEKEDHLDPELERLGRVIVENCKGLPLAISVISGLLVGCDNTEGLWEQVANDTCKAAAEKDDHFTKILSLSYDHLPHHLRPCLLYLGAFSKGAEIQVSRIKRLWAAESFLKAIKDKIPEEAVEQYLEDLEKRNLLVVQKRKSCGKVKIYGMHDLLKDLCVTRAEEEDFVVCSEYGHVMKALDRSMEAQRLRRVILSNKSFVMNIVKQYLDNRTNIPSPEVLFESLESLPLQVHAMVSKLPSASKLVRVLDASEIYLHEFPKEIVELVNIRYLSVRCKLLPPLLSRLWNLETLIFSCLESGDHRAHLPSNDSILIPDEIWELGKLKHFKIIGAIGRVELPYAFETLQTLSAVTTTSLMGVAKLIERIPNIKELVLDSNYGDFEEIDLYSLHNLENFKICRFSVLCLIRFPSLIAKLTLHEGYVDAIKLKVIGALPNLKVLKIEMCLFNSLGGENEWKTFEGEFPSLHFLRLEMMNLKKWNIEQETPFPELRHLHIRYCYKLEEIPSCIGAIDTLDIIEIHESSTSVGESATRIQQDNDGIQLRITHIPDEEYKPIKAGMLAEMEESGY